MVGPTENRPAATGLVAGGVANPFPFVTYTLLKQTKAERCSLSASERECTLRIHGGKSSLGTRGKMNEPARSLAASSGSIKVEFAKNRCRSVIDRIQALPPSKITDSCKRTLIKLADSELKFLSRLSLPHDFSGSISVNVGYLESVVHVLQQPFISGVSRVCKPIPLSSPHGKKCDSCSKGIHVDIVCTVDGNPFWFIISDRNPKYIMWLGSHRNKGLQTRVEHVLVAACSAVTLKPSSIVLFFSNGINEIVAQKLQDEFGASEFQVEFSLPDSSIFTELEEEWVYVTVRGKPSAFQLNIDHIEKSELSLDHGMRDPIMGAANLEPSENHEGFISTDAFSSLISTMRSNITGVVAAKPEVILVENLINFDTTALVALVSGISNGGAEQLLTATESEMRKRFKNNVKFVMAQVMSELQNPILGELRGVLSGKRGVICESVLLEFKELVSMYAGPNEKLRADRLLKQLMVVPDSPSERMFSLPTTRKIALKNKVVFGTGDYWRAPTLTANMGFVRAISQTGMSLLTLEHRPRALVGA